jgi:hypothetical protein
MDNRFIFRCNVNSLRVKKIVFEKIWEDVDLVEYRVNAVCGDTSASVEFYASHDALKPFADELKAFPQSLEHEIKYEEGELSPKSRSYFLMRFFCYQPNGHSAIHFKMSNNAATPYHFTSEFYILTVPASINKLGIALSSWQPEVGDKLEWLAE